MRYLLDDNGYYLGTVNEGSQGVEIAESLPSHTNIQKIRYDGSKWIVEDSESLRIERQKYEATQYQRDRLQEYPTIQDCIHALLDGGDTLTELQAKRAKVKAKYPKPSE